MTDASYPDLKDKTVFISGGASGIGEALVRAFAAQGGRVGFVDIADEAGDALAKELKAGGATIWFRRCDITDIPAYQTAIEAAAAALGPVRALMNNAANDVRHSLAGLTSEAYDGHVAVNLKHAVFAAQSVAPMMKEAGGGSIVNFGSVSWMIPQGGFPGYASSKSAMQGLTRTLARDLGPDRIRVNTLAPGWTITEKQRRLWLDEAGERAIAENQCLPGYVMPAHIAAMALFLASDVSAMCSSQTFIVDGGWV